MALFLVTGGAGFIGSNITSALLERGEKVRVIDDLSTGKLENIESLSGNIEFIEGDICDFDCVQKAVKDVDYILHQAALPSVPRSIKEPIASNRVNVEGTLNLLVAGRDANCKKLVMASSSSVYGDTPTLPKHEEMAPQPMSPYATSKLAAEKYAMNFHKVYGFPTVALRYFNVFGPRQDPNSHYAAVLPKFIKAMLSNEPPVIYGDGEQSRDFTYIENVVHANLLACESDAAGCYLNTACGGRYTLNHLIEVLEEVMGVSANQEYQAPRVGDVKHSHAAIELARKNIGYSPLVSFKDGVKKTVAWYREKFDSQS